MYRRSVQLLPFNSSFESNMSLFTNKFDSSIQMYRRSVQLLPFNIPFQSSMSLLTSKVNSSIQMYRRSVQLLLLTFHSKVTCLYLLVKLRSILRIPSGESLLTRQVLRERLSHILKENSSQFNEKDHSFLQSHGTAMGTKVLVAFANIFMAKMEHEIMRQSNTTLIFCKDLFMTSYRCGAQTETKLKNFCLKLSSYDQIYD